MLQRARERLEGEEGEREDLEERHAALRRRLAAKRSEKGRYAKLYAQGLLEDEELEVHLSDLKNQVENLQMLIASVEADLAREEEESLVARNIGGPTAGSPQDKLYEVAVEREPEARGSVPG